MLLSFLLSLSLSADALGIGLSYGLRKIRFPRSSLLLLSGETFLLITLYLSLGERLASLFPLTAAKLLSSLILFGFGIWLCLQGMGQKKEKAASPLHTPSLCDKDASAAIEPKEALLLGLLLSLDSCAISLSAAVGQMEVAWLPLCTALLQSLFLAAGAKLGSRLLLHPMPRENLWSLLSGGILLLLAILQIHK